MKNTMEQSIQKDIRGNFLSKLLFLWMEPIIFRGYRRKIQIEDIPDVPQEMQISRLKENFDKIWSLQGKNSLFRTFLIQNRYNIIISGLCVTLTNLCELCGIVMGWLVLDILINPDKGANLGIHGIVYCCVYTISTFVGAIANGKYLYISNLLDIKNFTQCVIALFQKSLSLPQDVLNEISIGRIVNMVANDIRSIEFKFFKLQYIWGFPLTLLGTILMLYFLVGPIALVGIGVYCFSVILMFAATPLMGKIKSKNLELADKRVKFINQVIKNMRIVKMFGWEELIIRIVERIRKKEWMYGLMFTLVNTGPIILFFIIQTPLAIYTTFLVSYLTDSPIRFGEAVLCFMLYQQIQVTTAQFMMFISASLDVYVSGCRISEFLNLEVCTKLKSENIPLRDTDSCCINIHKLTVGWSNQSKGLDNIDLKVTNKPQLIFLIGAVGAGKSTLLLTLCNEISQYQGHAQVNGRVAYSAQESWVFSGTIRDNILVGGEFEHDRYWKVLTVCGLISDLNSFIKKDKTLVGERGVTLSGGQRARVSLARAVYTVADIYLLDDPLGAVDTQVSKHIFEECIQGFLSDKVVILATHQTRFARNNDRMLKLENGEIIQDDKYVNMKSKMKKELTSEILVCESINDNFENLDGDTGAKLECVNESESEITNEPMSTALSEEKADRPRFWMYQYFKTGGLCITLLLILYTSVANVAQISFIWWIQKFMWLASVTDSYDNQTIPTNSTNLSSDIIVSPWFVHILSRNHFWAVTALLVGSICFLFQAWFTLVILIWRVAIKLHCNMLKSVIHTWMRFFEVNPSGRILSRFSKDTGYIDFEIPERLIDFWLISFSIIFFLIASCFVQKLLILPSIILILIFFASVRYYLPTVMELRSLESLLRSPLYSHISLSLQGMTTIRALGIQQKVMEDLLSHLYSYTKVWVLVHSSIPWFLQRLAFIVGTFLSIVIWTAFVKNFYYGANENIALSFQILFTIPLQISLVSIQAVHLNIVMVSVERVLSYIKQKPEHEYSRKNTLKTRKNELLFYPNVVPNTNKVCRGSITFEKVYMKYADDLPMVLNGISLQIEGGSKVGIVGRTGAGKSSIITALFRLTNLSQGRILIDNVDIALFTLNHLRIQISVIPQDPMLFTGTIRFNLDPFEQFSDAEIWSSLDHVDMRGLVRSLKGGIFAIVQEDGSNFSVGEKQLLCLARALLRNTRILVVDEATANVDHRTDAKIQNTLRNSFSTQTVISIAHRLNTVIDYDRIVVMDGGKIVEVDSPHLLLQDTNGYLTKLVSQTDPDTQFALRRAAHTAYTNSDQLNV